MDIDWKFISQSWLWEDDITFENSFIESDWTWEEDRAFENALISVHPDDVERWEKVASAVPGKTTEDLKRHYEALSGDVAEIESGEVPLPHCPRKVGVRRNSTKSPGSSMPRHPPKGRTNDEKKLLPIHPKEVLPNIGNQMLPPKPFAGMPDHPSAGVFTSSANTAHIASQPRASEEDCGVPPTGSSGSCVTSYSDYIDPDEFVNFPHFLD